MLAYAGVCCRMLALQGYDAPEDMLSSVNGIELQVLSSFALIAISGASIRSFVLVKQVN
jgi:hypothetical protein